MTSSSSKIASYLTSSITFMLENKDLYENLPANYWYDEMNFDISDIANEVKKNFPESQIIQIYNNGFKIKLNKTIIIINNYNF